MQQQDALAVAQNGGVVGDVADDGDVGVDGDEDLDDDDMDKISSSPSIEDGGYSLPPAWPRRVDSLNASISFSFDHSESPTRSDPRSSSPYLDSPLHLPLQSSGQQASKAAVDPANSRHHPGEYTGSYRDDHETGQAKPDESANEPVTAENDPHTGGGASLQAIDQGNSPAKTEPSMMAKYSGRAQESTTTSDHGMGPGLQHNEKDHSSRIEVADFSIDRTGDSAPNKPKYDEDEGYEFLIPYDSSSGDDDDDDDAIFVDDSRFIDSGWGGECLRDTEDIDFDFVYALHTFVATVEGQANATKGDTMVLLDDSNSYWWLVRVAKDSSIGMVSAFFH